VSDCNIIIGRVQDGVVACECGWTANCDKNYAVAGRAWLVHYDEEQPRVVYRAEDGDRPNL
jgi:hypothetical protein